MEKKENYSRYSNIVNSVAIAYYQVLDKLNDSTEPRSLMKRVKERKNISIITSAYVYFIAMVENAFLSLDRLSQQIIDDAFCNNSHDLKYIYPSSTYYRLKGKAFASFVNNMGLSA